jgi:hypothetical protein
MSTLPVLPMVDSEAMPSWVWRSSVRTTSASVLSVVAAIEVVFAVAGYWAIAVYTHGYWRLLTGVLIVPLFLLRSNEPVSLGAKWFSQFDGFINNFINSKGETLYDILRLMAIPSSPIIAALFRAAAISCYIKQGISQIPQNWWRFLFATEIFARPEIMPGYDNIRSIISMESLLTALKLILQDFKTEKNGVAKYVYTPLGVTYVSVTIILFLTSSFLYRVALKSTAWVHWPLFLIAQPPRYADDPEEIRIRLWRDPREWMRRLLAIATVAGAITGSLPSIAQAKEMFPSGVVSVAEYAVLINVHTLLSQPWRAAALAAGIITLLLIWYGLELNIVVARAHVSPARAQRAVSWSVFFEYAMRVRSMLGWMFWIIIVAHAALWLAPSTDWIPDDLIAVLRFLYGSYLPPSLRSAA